jgi:hypothetical protein
MNGTDSLTVAVRNAAHVRNRTATEREPVPLLALQFVAGGGQNVEASP